MDLTKGYATIKEGHTPLFEGSQNGLKSYTSSVPDRVAALAPQLAMVAMTERMANRMDNNDKPTYRPIVNIPEPFEKFNVELQLDHPYWQTIAFSVAGPDFNNSRPDANDYMREYYQKTAELEELARALMDIAFAGAGEITVGAANTAQQLAQASAAPVDSIEEIKRFKALMEEGIITEEEFAAKKKQLLGI